METVQGQVISTSRPTRSESIAKLGSALAKAQGQIENAIKDTKGNYGKYATLASTWDAIRKPLSDNEIAVYQRIITINDKAFMATMLIHSSGEFLDDCELELKFDANGRISAMQAMGSAVTYARRYSLQSVTGVAPADDDDGAGAGNPPPPQQQSKPEPVKSPQAVKKQIAQDALNSVGKKPVNIVPATQETLDILDDLSSSQKVDPNSMLDLLKVYDVGETEQMPNWVAQELIDFLSDPDFNIPQQIQKVKERKEIAAKKRAGEK